jgi:ribonuclease E
MGKKSIGFIGVGLMGHGAAKNILEGGFPLTVIGHRNREPVDDLLDRGASEALSAAELARKADIIFTCVSDSSVMDKVVLGEDGVLQGAGPGLILVDMTTSEPASTRRLAEALADKGAIMVDGLEMSRQRLRPGMLEATTQPCNHCHGTGLIRSDDSLALQVLRALEEEGTRKRSREVLVKLPVQVANYLMNEKREHLATVETRYGMAVRVEADPTLSGTDFTLEKFKTATRVVPKAPANVVAMDTSWTPDEDEVEEAEVVSDEGEGEGEEKPKKKRRRRSRRKKTGGGEAQAETPSEGNEGAEAAAAEAAPADAVVADPAESDAAEPQPAAPEAEAEETPKPKSRRRTRSRSKAAAQAEAASPVEAEAKVEPAVAEAPSEAPSEEPAVVSEPEPEPAAEAKPKKRARARAKAPAPSSAPAEPATEAPAAEPVASEPALEPVAAEAEPAAEVDGKKKKGWWSFGR